ncbi:MAG: ethanolamine ammonia-lyase reactivating factor EutA, partial [Minicystis sp.]
VFTPFIDERIDLRRIEALLDDWLQAAGARPEEIVGGGAIITGLCARRSNAGALAQLVRARIGGAVIATADDPCLEAFLAFMGSAAGLSLARPEAPILNLDIGGGTTNLALGLGGEVIAAGSLFVGARHVEVAPGTYEIRALSPQARLLFADLGLRADVGDALAPAAVGAVIDRQVALLEAAVSGWDTVFDTVVGKGHVDARFRLPAGIAAPWLTFSGGVGALLYEARQGRAARGITPFGDLGVELATRLLASPLLTARLLVPESTGRATSFGLLRHATRLSGSTLYLPRPELLPRHDLPIFGRIASSSSSAAQLLAALTLVRCSARGGCLALTLEERRPAALKHFAARLAEALRALDFPADLPLVLLVPDNLGKALGGYVTDWGRAALTLIVLDEVPDRGARFVQLGRLEEQVVPVSFYGMGRGDEP